jgi:hypothetical protein
VESGGAADEELLNTVNNKIPLFISGNVYDDILFTTSTRYEVECKGDHFIFRKRIPPVSALYIFGLLSRPMRDPGLFFSFTYPQSDKSFKVCNFPNFSFIFIKPFKGIMRPCRLILINKFPYPEFHTFFLSKNKIKIPYSFLLPCLFPLFKWLPPVSFLLLVSRPSTH